MRVLPLVLSLMGALCATEAFVHPHMRKLPSLNLSELNAMQTTTSEDCGCSEVIMSGKPTDKAKALNAREVIGNYSVLSARGDQMPLDKLAGSDVSIVVFLRSLG